MTMNWQSYWPQASSLSGTVEVWQTGPVYWAEGETAGQNKNIEQVTIHLKYQL